MPTTKRVAQPIDVAIGARLKHLRTTAQPKPLSIEQFGAQMRERVGRGWYPAAVLKIESGRQRIGIAELAAAADIFHCTIADIVNISTPVDLGGETDSAIVPRIDAAMSGEDAMPEAVVFAHFERAADALAEQRFAEERYRHEIGIVRRAIAKNDEMSAVLKARIESYMRRAIETARAEVNEQYADDIEHSRILGIDPPPDFCAVTPAIVAAHDAVSTHQIPTQQWQRRPIRKENQ